MGKRELVALPYLSSWCLVRLSFFVKAYACYIKVFGIVIDRKHIIKYWRFFSIAPAQDNEAFACPWAGGGG